MAASLLARLPATVAQIAHLPPADRMAAIQFLLEWGAVNEALACLAEVDVEAGEEWHLLAADALRRGRRAEEAILLLDRLLVRVDLLDARVLRVRSLLALGRLRDALEAAEALAAEQPDDAAVWLLVGDLHLARGDSGAAEIAFVQAERLEPAGLPARIGLLRAARLAGPAALRAAVPPLFDHPGGWDAFAPDDLQELRSALIAQGDLARAAVVSQEMVARFDREADRVRTRLAAPAPATPAAPAAPPPETGVRVSAQELAEVRTAARRLFGYGTLLPLQADIITAARRGEDVLAVLPTGGGKSLCYQLPAFLDGGLTLVVSPLVALMKDQVDRLPARLRPAAVALTAALDFDAQRAALEGVEAGRYRLLFVAPERLRRRPFVEQMRRAGIKRLVIDEAHCVAVWGHDFRPDYLHLAQAHADMGAPPILALTATAPPAVRDEIERHLFAARSDRPLRVIAADASRPNLWLGAVCVRDEADKRARVAALCRTLPGSGIVYVRARGQADELAAQLREEGIAAAAYHAGRQDRPQVQEKFMAGALRVVVATVAFGMGVDKGDIRFVLHAGLPSSLEGYAQEVGRAGRDRQPATCLLFYHERDLESLVALARREPVDMPLIEHLLDLLAQRTGIAQGKGAAAVDAERLASELSAQPQDVRVALSLLEEAGLLERHYDAPQTLKLYLRRASRGLPFQRFLQAAHLRAGSPAEWPAAELARAARLPLAELEPRLLDWQAQGFLKYYPSGRQMVITLRAGLQSLGEAGGRVRRLVEQRTAARVARAQEVARFAQATECRHLLLNAALGGLDGAPCRNCDACGVPLTNLVRGA